MNSIEGAWSSRYEYIQGSASELSVGEHQVQFALTANGWVGKSLSQPDDSTLTLELTQNDVEFSGVWHERTSPSGNYKAREFSGLLMLILNDEGTELNGMWLGASSSTGGVKAGSWILQKATN